MVKLFVGNLAESVDSDRLRNLFLQHVTVQECDVLKNFAFVHVPTEEDADIAIKELNKTQLEGREIHIERSTSRLRKEPGMGDKCFTCGAGDHKTPQCPQEQGRRQKKRPNETDDFQTKRPNNGVITLTQPTTTPQCWGYKVGGSTDDQELPCPTNPELRPLYEQYIEARTRYHYFREKLSKELALQPGGAQSSTPVQPVNIGRFDLTRPLNQPQPVNPSPSIQQYPGVSAPTVYPGYQSITSYPGAQQTAAPYPGVQTVSSYPGSQSSYGYNTPTASQHTSPPGYSTMSYSTPQNYRPSYSTPTTTYSAK